MDRQIAAAKITKLLPTMVGIPTERVARELAPLADRPAAVAGAWERVTELTHARDWRTRPEPLAW